MEDLKGVLEVAITSITVDPIYLFLPGVISLFSFVAFNFIYQGHDEIPLVGSSFPFEPSFFSGIRFCKGALPLVNEGYQKFKDGLFRLTRLDGKIVVVSNKFVDELRNLPEQELSSSRALYRNLTGRYTGLSIMYEGHLHIRTLQNKLTPSLGSLTGIMKEEIDLALQDVMLDCQDDWVEVNILEIMLSLVSRVSNRVFLGKPDCYNQAWARESLTYSGSFTWTAMILRHFPPILRPLVAPFVPSFWKLQSSLRKAKKALIPTIEKRRKAQDAGDSQKQDNFLQWMMDAATPDEGGVEKMAHRQLNVILGSGHTSTMAGTHVCYDLCAKPEYFEPLRNEIDGLLKKEKKWNKNVLSNMWKMDSFLKESQRLSPASILDFHRMVRAPLTLSNGVHLPAGTYLCAASDAIAKDPINTPDAHQFDGLRYYKKRQDPKEMHRHQFATTDKNHLHFGHGKYACPGRFFASDELKLILGHLIMKYDMSFLPGQSRPVNLNADEFMYPDPTARLRIKERHMASF